MFTHAGPFQYRVSENSGASTGTLGTGNAGQYEVGRRSSATRRSTRSGGTEPAHNGRKVATLGCRMG